MTLNGKAALTLSLVTLLAVAYSCHGYSANTSLRWQADRLELKTAQLKDKAAVLSATNDSLRAIVAATDSAYVADSIRWGALRQRLAHSSRMSAERYEAHIAALRSTNATPIPAVADSLDVAYRATVDAYEARIATYEDQVASLTVRVGHLQGLIGGLESELNAQMSVVRMQQREIANWQEIANPPWYKRLKTSIPSVSVGASLAILGLIAAGSI